MRRNHIGLALVCALAALGSACAAPRVLTHQGIVGERSAKYSYQKTGDLGSGDQNAVKLYDYMIKLCDYNDDGTTTKCKDTLLLRNVRFVP
jgi:hypothetical protein